MEVLVSIGILSLGLVGVAAVFPSAIFLQKQAVNEAFQHQHTRSADSVLQGKGLANVLLIEAVSDANAVGYFSPPANEAKFEVYPFCDIQINSTPPIADPAVMYADSLLLKWPVEDRSYPSVTPDPADREFYWVPMLRRGPEANDYIADWDIFVFMLMPHQQDHTFDEAAVLAEYSNVVCGNDTGNLYEPKVYRVDIIDINNNVISLPNHIDRITVPLDPEFVADNSITDPSVMKLGDQVLGDNGDVYRITAANGGEITVTPSPSIDPAKEPNAIWFAAPANFDGDGDTDNPVVMDIRLLSNNIVRLPPLN